MMQPTGFETGSSTSNWFQNQYELEGQINSF